MALTQGSPYRQPQHPSPLRRARWHRNWTLDEVLSELDRHSPDSSSAITPSQLSAWELARHRTSARHRKVICALYGEPPEVLFAHQDGGAWDTPLTNAEAPLGNPARAVITRLLTSHRDLMDGMLQVVHEAQQYLVVTGSRSQDTHYLDAIVDVLRERPTLLHYRVLFGPPHYPVLKEHLQEVLRLRDPHDRSTGHKSLHVGILADLQRWPERFFCACERSAVLVIPSLTAAEGFDSGIRLEGGAAWGLVQHGIQAYAGSRPVETAAALAALSPLQSHLALVR